MSPPSPDGLRATRRLLHLGLLVGAAIVVALVTRQWYPAAAAVPLLGILLFSFLEAALPMPRTIERRFDVGTTLLLGDKATETSIVRPAFLPQNMVLDPGRPEGLRALADGRTAFQPTADGGAAASTRVQPRRRGDYPFDPAVVRRVGALGLFEHAATLQGSTRVLVLPSSARQLGLRVRPRPPTRASEMSRSLRAGPGDEFYALREYQPGDPIGDVNWKASARMQRIITNEFLPQEPPRYLLYVDTRAPTAEVGESDAFERTLELASILIDALMESRAQVGIVLLSLDSVFLVPGAGANQLRRLRQMVIEARPGDDAPLLQLLQAGLPHLPARCDAILLTANAYDPTLDQSVIFLRARHTRCTVLFPGFPEPQGDTMDAAVQRAAGVLLNTEQAAILAALRPYATHAAQWPPDEAIAVTLGRLGLIGRKR